MIDLQVTMKVKDSDIPGVVSKLKGMTEAKMGELAQDVAAQARSNASGLPFKESTGTLASKIEHVKMGDRHYRIQTTSGYASYLEFGTQYIKGKMPFLWPAYRSEKKKFMRRKWF